jgi:hypothetical protein
MYERGVSGGVLILNSTNYPDHGRTAEPGIEPGTSWLVVRCSDHQASTLSHKNHWVGNNLTCNSVQVVYRKLQGLRFTEGA